MLAGLLEVVDRAVDVAAIDRALGVSAVQLDDFRRRQELPCAGAQEFGEEWLKAMAGSGRAVADDEAGLLERGHQLTRSAACRHGLVFLEPLEERPAEERVLVGP